MTIQSFIEKACEGTFYLYDPYYRSRDKVVKFHMLLHERVIVEDEHGFKHRIPISDILLNPLAWKAVGKVEGWADTHEDGKHCFGHHDCPCNDAGDTWLDNMHGMIDALADGKTIEEYLATLTSSKD